MLRTRIRTVDDIVERLEPDRPIITLYSGGLDSTYLLKLLHDQGFSNVIALTVDVGSEFDWDRIRERSGKLGAQPIRVDAKEKFVTEFLIPAIKAQAVYAGMHPISASLSRPLLAQIAVEVARQRGAQAILHSAHPSQNTMRRLNNSFELLGYAGEFGSPYEDTPVARLVEIDELGYSGVDDLADRVVSTDVNIWCREFESGPIEDPESFTVPDYLYKWTKPAPGLRGKTVEIAFEAGTPSSLNGEALDLPAILELLNLYAGTMGIGRYASLEHIHTGEKVLEVREAPGASVLINGYAHLLAASVDYEIIREKIHIDQLWVREAVEGRWFGGLRSAAQAFIDSVSAHVTGSVVFSLEEGRITLVSVRSATPRYIRSRGQWEAMIT
jgi:argininosuccinate synthase